MKRIYSFDPTGRADFRGSEYVPARRLAISAMRQRLEDRYGWWEPARGGYLVEFNEALELTEDEMALIEPAERLFSADSTHTAITLRECVEPVEALVEVGALSLEMKENARISRIRAYRLGAGNQNGTFKDSITQRKTAGAKRRRRGSSRSRKIVASTRDQTPSGARCPRQT